MRSAFDNPKAFAPFFDDLVVVEGRRGADRFREACRACVLDSGFVDTDADAVAQSDEHVFSVRILRRDWPDGSGPRIGDTVRLDGGRVLRITECVADSMSFTARAKSKGAAS